MKLLVLLLTSCLASIDFGVDFCPPTWPRPKGKPSDIDQPAPIFLGEDPDSGCLCREVPEKFVVCFGREICKRFPRSIQVNQDVFRVKATAITEIVNGDLMNLEQLEVLEIEGNSDLARIEAGVFVNMTNLRNLSISYSKRLESLEEGVFEGLVSLRQLYLVQNGFTNIAQIAANLGPSYLPNIYKIELSENTFNTINENDLSPMKNSSVKELNLILCQIEYIHPRSLNPLRNLTVLRLGENVFTASSITELISTMVRERIPLKTLNLFGVGFRKSPPTRLLKVIAISNITDLILARNQFEAITADSFPAMPNLEMLNLGEVLALNVTNEAFSDMPKLRTLLLSGNKLSVIPDGVLLKQLTYLDLSGNSGNVFFPSYFSLGANKFVNMSNLAFLNLNFNRVQSLYNDTFTGLTNLLALGLRNATIFHIGKGAFSTLPSLRFLNLENNPFGSSQKLVKEMFEGLEKLEVLLLGGCLISDLGTNSSPFEYLESLKHLGLERNNLLTISSQTFLPLKRLTTIDLSGNSLTPWQNKLFGSNDGIEEVSASHNKFTYLTIAMLSDFSALQSLDVSANPFACECSTYETVRDWRKDGNDTIFRLLRQRPSYCLFPDSLTNITIDTYLQTYSYCDFDDLNLVVYIVTPIIVLIFALLVASFFVYKYRWHLRYWVFLVRLQLIRTGKKRHKTPLTTYTNYEFDAFVSYSNEDRNFVVRLVAMLENYEPFFKLCVYERDFQAGSYISESVLESVAKSRKTLLVISDSYAKSQWCRWETQVVEHHRLFFENEFGEYVDDSLILIKLGPVSESHLTPTLRYLMKTRIYLEWNAEPDKQKVFWERLRRALAQKKKWCSEDV